MDGGGWHNFEHLSMFLQTDQVDPCDTAHLPQVLKDDSRPQACVVHYKNKKWTMVRCWVLRYEEAIKSILDFRKIVWFGCVCLSQQTFSSASSLQTSSDTCCQMDPLGYIVELEDASQKKVKSSLDEHDARDLCRDAFNWICRFYDNSKNTACCFHCRWQYAVFKTYQSAYNIWYTQGRVSEYLEEDQKC